MEASILDLRKHMSKIIEALDMNESIKLTYRGKEKATIVPLNNFEQSDLTKNEAFGLWSDREEFCDVPEVVRKIRRGRLDAF